MPNKFPADGQSIIAKILVNDGPVSEEVCGWAAVTRGLGFWGLFERRAFLVRVDLDGFIGIQNWSSFCPLE
jgi:hypothetical protein